MIGLATIGGIAKHADTWLKAQLSAAVPGTFTNLESMPRQIGDDEWQYDPLPGKPLTFTRSTGVKIVLDKPFLTDLASIPIWLGVVPGLAKWDLGPASVVHDWLYTQHHLGQDVLGFNESNLCLEEMLLSLQPPWRTYRRCEAYVIREACGSPIGWAVWNGHSKLLP
jgi:hypothetical protein